MGRNEHKIQADIIKYLRANRVWHFRFNASAALFGLPDIIALHKGRFIAIEVKDPDGIPTSLQLKTIEAIKKAGGIGFFPCSVAEVRVVIEKL